LTGNFLNQIKIPSIVEILSFVQNIIGVEHINPETLFGIEDNIVVDLVVEHTLFAPETILSTKIGSKLANSLAYTTALSKPLDDRYSVKYFVHDSNSCTAEFISMALDCKMSYFMYMV
jgi:hypothetical protein